MGKRKPNPGEILATRLEVTTALERVRETGLKVVAGIEIGAALEAAHLEEDVALGDAADVIARLIHEIHGDDRPLHLEIESLIEKTDEILRLKGWPDLGGAATEFVREMILERDGWPELWNVNPPAPKPLTSDQRWEREVKLQAICAELGLEHAVSCYEENVGDMERNTFWVCKPGCPTLEAKKILDEREKAAPKP